MLASCRSSSRRFFEGFGVSFVEGQKEIIWSRANGGCVPSKGTKRISVKMYAKRFSGDQIRDSREL